MIINRSIYFVLLALLIISCSSSLEDRARSQMQKTLKNEFKYASDFNISKENVIYSSDSVFIMVFHMKGKKDNGDLTEGTIEYGYREISMWAYDHPEVRLWDDYFREIGPFGKNSVELYMEEMKEMTKKQRTMLFKTPYSTIHSVLFSINRKVPSEFDKKVDEYKNK